MENGGPLVRELPPADRLEPTAPAITTPPPSSALASVRCSLLGHKVYHTRIPRDDGAPCRRCGAAILELGGGLSRVAHTLSCFLGEHHYSPLSVRAGHREYVCERCGHTLLMESNARAPATGEFKKRVSYACGLLGHRVHVVAAGSGATEYACRCGHPFVKAQAGLTVIRHPAACALLGHLVTVSRVRTGWAEYVCRRCGHPFCFRLAATDDRGPRHTVAPV